MSSLFFRTAGRTAGSRPRRAIFPTVLPAGATALLLVFSPFAFSPLAFSSPPATHAPEQIVSVPTHVIVTPGDFFVLPIHVVSLPDTASETDAPSGASAAPGALLTIRFPSSWSLLGYHKRSPAEGATANGADVLAKPNDRFAIVIGPHDEGIPPFLTFHVPPDARAGPHRVSFTLKGPEMTIVRHVTAYVQPVMELIAEPAPTAEGFASKGVDIPLTLHNRGNVPLRVDADVRVPHGWAVSRFTTAEGEPLEESAPLIGPGTRLTMMLTALPRAHTRPGTYPVTVQFTATPVLPLNPGINGDGIEEEIIDEGDPRALLELPSRRAHAVNTQTVTWRAAVTILPPPPDDVPRRRHRTAANVRFDIRPPIWPMTGAGPNSVQVRTELHAALPAPAGDSFPLTRTSRGHDHTGGYLRLISEVGPDTDAVTGPRLRLADFDYFHPRGWRLRQASRSLDDPLPAHPGRALHLDTPAWSLAASISESGSRLSGKGPLPPATVTWRPAPAVLPLALRYRLGTRDLHPAGGAVLALPVGPRAHVGVNWARAGTVDGWSVRTGWASTPGDVSMHRFAPHWRVRGQWEWVPIGFDAPHRGRRAAEWRIDRLTPSSQLSAAFHYRLGEEVIPAVPPTATNYPPSGEASYPPSAFGPPIDSWHYVADSTRLTLRGGSTLARSSRFNVYGELAWARTRYRERLEGIVSHSAWAKPPPAEISAVRHDVTASLHISGARDRLVWRSRWHRDETEGCHHTLSWRRPFSSRAWWQLSTGYAEYRTLGANPANATPAGTYDGTPDGTPLPSASPSRSRDQTWQLGVRVGGRTATGFQWSGGLRWPRLKPGHATRPGWHLSVSTPSRHDGQWRIAISGSTRTEVRLAYTRRFDILWPFGDPSVSQLEGTLHVPHEIEAFNLAGAILRWGDVQASSDAAGRFRFPPLPPGQYTLSVERLPPAVASLVVAPDPITVTARAGKIDSVRIPLIMRGSIRGRLAAEPGIRGEGDRRIPPYDEVLHYEAQHYEVQLVDEGGMTIAQRLLTPGQAFEFPSLAPGLYTLSVRRALAGQTEAHDTAVSVTTVHVPAGETSTVTVPLPPPERKPEVTFVGEERWPSPQEASGR